MNKFKCSVSKIENIESLNLVYFSFKSTTISMVSLDLSENITTNRKVILSLKPTNITLAKNFEGLVSSSNKLLGKIVFIEQGKLLSSVVCEVFDTQIESIITTNSLKQMKLAVDDEITLLFKASDISILEIVDV